MKNNMRELTSAKCAHALDTLSHIPKSGVGRIPGDQRLFKITRALIDRDETSNTPEEEPVLA